MKLIELVKNIENVDDELIIFFENISDINSDILLSVGDEKGNVTIEESDKTYRYLIEVYLAKEFIQDWKSSLNYSPTETEIALRLYQYAIDDA